jgi:hypothetical protein
VAMPLAAWPDCPAAPCTPFAPLTPTTLMYKDVFPTVTVPEYAHRTHNQQARSRTLTQRSTLQLAIRLNAPRCDGRWARPGRASGHAQSPLAGADQVSPAPAASGAPRGRLRWAACRRLKPCGGVPGTFEGPPGLTGRLASGGPAPRSLSC